MATKTANMKGLKSGHYVMIEGEPCKVSGVTLSKPGKHGSTKAKLEAVGIFDGRKRIIVKPADSDIQVPIIEKKKAQVISVSGNFVQLMDLEEYDTFEATIPDEFRGKLSSGGEVGYWKIGEKILLKEA